MTGRKSVHCYENCLYLIKKENDIVGWVRFYLDFLSSHTNLFTTPSVDAQASLRVNADPVGGCILLTYRRKTLKALLLTVPPSHVTTEPRKGHVKFIYYIIAFPRNTIAFPRNNIAFSFSNIIWEWQRHSISRELNTFSRESNTYFEVTK